MGLNEGIEAARMPMLVSMTDQYMGGPMAQVGSLDTSMEGTKVMRTMEEIQALCKVSYEDLRSKGVIGVRMRNGRKPYKNPKLNITPTATFCFNGVCRFNIMRIGSAYVIKSVAIFNAAFER